MAKNTFASHTFRSKHFASGNWVGTGPAVIAVGGGPRVGIVFSGGAGAGRVFTPAAVGRVASGGAVSGKVEPT